VEAIPGFASGEVSVQDAAAQLAAGLLNLEKGHRVLDLCAAPGGKTAHILECCPEISELVAVDVSGDRLVRVQDNLDRIGLKATLVTADALTPADWWDQRPFDRILVDAPCSATGVIRRHPDIKVLRQPSDIDGLCRTQLQILEAAWSMLAKGGQLLYATCSVLRAENEETIARFLREHAEAAEVPINADWGVAVSHGRQILTGMTNMDGFYYARLAKTEA
jgi:16S rRNA (cytosine967-C5)-methyltransferase